MSLSIHHSFVMSIVLFSMTVQVSVGCRVWYIKVNAMMGRHFKEYYVEESEGMGSSREGSDHRTIEGYPTMEIERVDI